LCLFSEGFFGSGLYATFQPEYAALYPAELYPTQETEQGELAIVAMWALFGNMYSITRADDYTSDVKSKAGSANCAFFGKPMAGVHDSHFVQVDPDLGFQAVDPAKKPQPKLVLEEVVFKNEAQLLPRYIIDFKDLKLKLADL
jgi:hypothetical protein